MHHCTGLSHLASTHENLVLLAEDEECFNDSGHLSNDLHVLMLSNPGWENDSVGWALHESSDNDNLHFFRRITHLRLEGPAGLEVGMHLDHMDRLTHLAIPFPNTEEDLELVLEEHLTGMLDVLERTSVEVFVIVLSLEVQPEDQCQDIEKWVCEVRNKGASGVYVVRTVYDDLEEEWDAEVKGGVTMWKRAVEYTRLLVGRTHPRIDLTTPVDLPHEILHSIFLYAAESSTSSVTPCLRFPSGPTFRAADAVRHLWVPFASETLRSVVRQCDNVTISPSIITTSSGFPICSWWPLRAGRGPMERRTIEGWIGDFTKDSEGGIELYAVMQLYSEPKMEWEAEKNRSHFTAPLLFRETGVKADLATPLLRRMLNRSAVWTLSHKPLSGACLILKVAE
ncbi:hypothetical protein BD779DRAFT_1475761 [Infundibulicybe gibba]|nr:hypothetical protein BD779DRAFT_1475761 [Infundibulicybe gibba]